MNTSEPGRFFDADVNPIPIIRGLQDYDRALLWHQEAHKHDVDSDVKEAIARKLKQLDQ